METYQLLRKQIISDQVFNIFDIAFLNNLKSANQLKKTLSTGLLQKHCVAISVIDSSLPFHSRKNKLVYLKLKKTCEKLISLLLLLLYVYEDLYFSFDHRYVSIGHF